MGFDKLLDMTECLTDRFPLSPRVTRLRAILAKLGVGSAPAMPYSAPKPPGDRSMALARKRRQ